MKSKPSKAKGAASRTKRSAGSQQRRVRVPSRIPLELGVKGAHISLVRGALPYLWIGDKGCYGVVPYEQVARLKEMVKAL